jgi:hypothetical protein
MHFGYLIGISLAALLLGAGPLLAHHDDIPDPPPLSVSQPLPTHLRLDPTTVTVSGLSSGGFFAHQFHVAFSRSVAGAPSWPAGPMAAWRSSTTRSGPPGKLDRTSAAVVACTHYLGSRYWGLRAGPPRAEDVRN